MSSKGRLMLWKNKMIHTILSEQHGIKTVLVKPQVAKRDSMLAVRDQRIQWPNTANPKWYFWQWSDQHIILGR